VHGDPIQGVDPTGLFFGVSNAMAGIAGIGGLIGFTYGGIRGFIDSVSDPDLTWTDVAINTFEAAAFGALFGAGFAAIGAYMAGLSSIAFVGFLGGSAIYGMYGNYSGIRESFARGKYVQGTSRIAFAVLDIIMITTAVKGSRNATSSPHPANTPTPAGKPYLNGAKVDSRTLGVFKFAMRLLGVEMEGRPPGAVSNSSTTAKGTYTPKEEGGGIIRYEDGHVTYYTLIHEMFHAIHHKTFGKEFSKHVRSKDGRADAEDFVYQRLKDLFWGFLNEAERADAKSYRDSFFR
jgi:hypothetical protein